MANLENNTAIQFSVAESYKTIRTNLLFLLSQIAGCKVITVSSPKACEGKTTNAINIAIAFSQLGKRVLLIDADLRRPTIARKLKLENTDGLTGILAGLCGSSEAIITVNPSFDVLTSGIIPPNPSELLASSSFDKLISSLRLAYDYIIIDTPPAGMVSDALLVAPKTEGILLVVKEKATSHNDFERLLDNLKLADIKVLGAVLNGSRSKEAYSNYKSVY